MYSKILGMFGLKSVQKQKKNGQCKTFKRELGGKDPSGDDSFTAEDEEIIQRIAEREAEKVLAWGRIQKSLKNRIGKDAAQAWMASVSESERARYQKDALVRVTATFGTWLSQNPNEKEPETVLRKLAEIMAPCRRVTEEERRTARRLSSQ